MAETRAGNMQRSETPRGEMLVANRLHLADVVIVLPGAFFFSSITCRQLSVEWGCGEGRTGAGGGGTKAEPFVHVTETNIKEIKI